MDLTRSFPSMFDDREKIKIKNQFLQNIFLLNLVQVIYECYLKNITKLSQFKKNMTEKDQKKS